MVDSELHLTFDGPDLGLLVVQVAAWTVVVLACLLVVRRPWAWPGLAGGLLGTVASIVLLVDHLQVRSEERTLGAHVFDTSTTPDFPGFVIDRDLQAPLDWAQAVALALLAAAVLAAAVATRRRAQPTAP